jgi:LPS sulfotransferase NodH
MRVVYEDMVAALEETIVDVLRFLEVELPPLFEPPGPTIERQADALNDAWEARYRAEVP